ncbi:Glu-tRNA(Gln) amidotransferase subunit GatD [Candidatus Woesearchaeota archaeon]|nr:Glu-tRNA(Gln) amidotransferase subunit GatD [Candidatus Woesearchaeota archaeon]
MAKQGDKVRVHTKDEIIEGIFVPSFEKDIIVIKLENGYNIGLNEDRVVRVEVVKSAEERKSKLPKVASKKGLPKISILHTGGTIASKVDYETGGVIAQFTPEELVQMFPEISDIANIHSRLIRNIQSEMMRFAHYNIIAKEIQKEIKKGASGIVITHGTDTMHYTAAALSFILQDLSVPVILVGAQRSSDRGSTDAALNIFCAVSFAANSDFAEVAICMHETISDDSCILIPGLKSRKLHTSRRDAFKPINVRPWARVDKNGTITYLRKTYRHRSNSKLRLMPIKENIRVGILRTHTNMYANQFLCYKGYDGLVLELTGLGHAPTSQIDEFTKEHFKIRKAIEDLSKKTVLVAAPQTIFGRLQMDVYSPGRDLQKLGVLGNFSDMTTETAFIKLAWLLSNYTKKEVRELYDENIKGEISERIEENTFIA